MFPVDPYEEYDEEGEDVGSCYVYEKNGSSKVAKGEHGKHVSARGVDILEVVDHVDGNENTACEDSNGREEPSNHAQETKEGDSIESDFVQQFAIFGVYQWREPAKESVRYPRWNFIADMILHFWFVYDLK